MNMSKVKQVVKSTDIKKLLEDKIKPFIQMDGGDIEFVDFNDAEGVVKVKLSGACVGCGLADITLKLGVEKELRKRFPDIKEVITID